jgi:hypothetical protein
MASEFGNGGLHDEVKTATIHIFGNHEAAQLAASNLEAHGIQCWINSDDAGGMYPNLALAGGGVRLLVRVSDAEAAITLLESKASPAEIDQIENEAVASLPSEAVPLKKLSWGQILFGAVIGIILCLFFQWANNLGTKTYYHHVHGKVDKMWIYRNGYLAEFSEDRNLDGVMDYWVHYDAYGRESSAEYDNNFDGKPDEWWTFSDDGTDTLQKDNDFNGIPDEFCVYKNRIIQQMDMKPNGSKFTTTREIFQNGVLTEISRGGDSSGHFKEAVKYDPFFNPIPIGLNLTSTNPPAAFQLLSPSSK